MLSGTELFWLTIHLSGLFTYPECSEYNGVPDNRGSIVEGNDLLCTEDHKILFCRFPCRHNYSTGICTVYNYMYTVDIRTL